MKLAESLLAYRKREGVTQQDLAGRAGVSVRTLRDIERGLLRDPRARSVRLVAEAAGLPVADPEPALRVGLLGPLTLRVRGCAADLRPPMQRRLLGLLALRAGHVVTMADIVEFLWGEEIPASYHNLVHTHVSRLRGFLAGVRAGAGAGLIGRAGEGYRLGLAGDESDLLAFTGTVAGAAAHLAAGAPEEAERAYERALLLWRGQVLAGLAPRAAHHPVVVAVSQQRLTAVLAYADLAMAHGRHEPALARLREVAAAEPLHEGLNARVLRALAGAGQRAAALRLFGELRGRLRDELGVEPGPELHDAHARVLRREAVAPRDPGAPPAPAVASDQAVTSGGGRSAERPPPSLPAGSPTPAQLPPDIATFTGRERELRELAAHLGTGDPAPTAARVAVVSGTAGVGKTALAVHWSHRVRRRFTDGQLFYNLHGYSPEAARTAADALTSFLLALGVRPGAVPPDVEARVSLFRSLTADRRLLLVLDNVTSPEQVFPLIPASGHSAVLVTSRNDLSGLNVHGDALITRLDVLAPGDAAGLLTQVLGAAAAHTPPEVLAELARLCANLPLALRIAAANIRRGGYGTAAAYVTALRGGDRLAELAIDGTGGTGGTAVEAAFELSYSALAPSAARVFRLLSLVPGMDFTLDAVAALTGSGADVARRQLSALTGAYLVDQHVPGRYRFHDLLRLYSSERAAAEESSGALAEARQRLHTWYLLNTRAAVGRCHPYYARLPLGPAPAGVAVRSFDDPASAAAWLTAEQCNLVAAVHQAARSGPRASAWLLTDALRSHFWHTGTMQHWLSCARSAMAAAFEEGDLAGRAAATLALANAHAFQEDPVALPLYTRALALAEQGGWTEGVSSVRNNLAVLHLRMGRLHEAARCLREGIARDQAEGPPIWQAPKLVNLGAVHARLGRLESAHRHLTRALRLRPGDTDGMIARNLGEVCRLLGRFDEALRHLRLARSRAEAAGSSAVLLPCLVDLAEVHGELGEHDVARSLAERALAVSRDVGDRLSEAMARNSLGTICGRAGRRAEAAEHHRQALFLAGDVHLAVRAAALIGLAGAADSGTEAAGFAGQALLIARERSFRLLEGLAYTVLAEAALAAGDRAEAVRQGHLALAVHRETGHRPGEARVLRALAVP
ncbi:tetratricopeptide repeat protein [Nonomuraea sp. NPDC049637]|uniref:tetratricopeptide repeat protein n=1 Tax=Nonomuraea sp. NPDC049637 TaxID=3154356 RepID=UPI00343B37BF